MSAFHHTPAWQRNDVSTLAHSPVQSVHF